MPEKKRFFANHAKSSAALISLGVHAILIVVALSFVAVTVINKEDKKFEAKPVKRPKMALKKLKVPVTVKKKKMQKPKLRKRIVVSPRMNQNMPDIKMPELSGVKGGLGADGGGGLGGAAGLGFSMPEINIFGVKGKGEKIILALGTTTEIMEDKRGGIPAYSIIKGELIRIVNELPPTTLLNVFVYDGSGVAMAFPNLVPANAANAKKIEDWLKPLNAVRKGMGARDYGLHTLGKGGTIDKDKLVAGLFEDTKKIRATDKIDVRNWYRPAMLAQKMQADTIFILTDRWDVQRVPVTDRMNRDEWNKTTAGKKWKESHAKGLKLLDAENKKRLAAGQAPMALNRNEWDINREFFPGIQRPPVPEFYDFSAKDFAEAFVEVRERFKPKTVQTKSGIGRGKKSARKVDFSFNVIQLVPQGEGPEEKEQASFQKLTSICKGDYKTIAGLAEVQSYVKDGQ